MLHFIFGTRAELIKSSPILLGLKKAGVNYNFISTGHQNLVDNCVIKLFKLKNPDVVMDTGPELTAAMAGPNPSVLKMFWRIFTWFINGLLNPKFSRKNLFRDDRDGIVVIHGDTPSSLQGALIAKKFGMRILHLESGLRTGHLLDPFPEELTRRFISRISDVLFCPGDYAVKNVSHYKKQLIINSKENTSYDCYINVKRNFSKIKTPRLPRKYFIFILHRPENLIDKKFVTQVIDRVLKVSKSTKCLFITPQKNEGALTKYGLYGKIVNNPNIIVTPKFDFTTFIKILYRSEFLLTDGGSNQQEAFYMGVPTLLLRKVTETTEGIGTNVVLSKHDMGIIDDFFKNYRSYRKKPPKIRVSATKIIVREIIRLLNKTKKNGR